MKANFSLSKRQLLPPILTSGALKWIALITMFIDHIGAVILEKGVISAYNQGLPTALSYDTSLLFSKMDFLIRQIGRISFPIFCFLLVEGFYHTSNRKKYALRLFLFACISEIPFDLCFRGKVLEFSYQNVMFTLLIGFLTMWAMEILKEKKEILGIIPAVLGILTGFLFQADYNWKGIVLILVFYVFYFYPVEKTVAGCLALYWEPTACLAFIPINLYNHQKGNGPKYFFYFFYPVHLLLFFFIRYAVFGLPAIS